MEKQYEETLKEIEELKNNLENEVEYTPIKSPVKRFRYFMKDKSGKEVSFKEFMQRWKKGMQGVTQYQQVKMQLNSTYIMLIGILCGFIITCLDLGNLWWLSIILGAAFFNTGVSALGLWQRKIALGAFEDSIKHLAWGNNE